MSTETVQTVTNLADKAGEVISNLPSNELVISAQTKLDEALGLMITKICSGVDQSLDFLGGQIPDVIKQLLLWRGIDRFIHMIIGVILLMVVLFIVRSIIRQIPEFNENNGVQCIYLFGKILSIFICGLVGCANINIEWLQIWIAPKIWLLEYVANLARTATGH